MNLSSRRLEATAGITGALVMILELTASRVLAPAIGTSLVAWTGIIGCIMATLSLGYLVGGRLADRPKTDVLHLILLGAALALAVTAYVSYPALRMLETAIGDLRLRSILATLLLFGPATACLGAVLPYCTGRAIGSLRNAGEVVGRIYTYSTIGSILGTFLSGFYLISVLGNAKTLILLSGILLLLAAFWFPWNKPPAFPFFLFIGTIALAASALKTPSILSWPGSLIDFDTMYSRYWIVDAIDQKTGRPARYLKSSPYGSQSSMFLDRDDDLVAPYLKFFRLAFHFNPKINESLMIGGGGYAFPKDYTRRHPDKHIAVVEIDQKLTDISKTYFNLAAYPGIPVYSQDARLFLKSITKLYDVIFVDAFDPQYTIPFHLTTLEMAQNISNRLTPEGMVLMNIISSVAGPQSKFLAAEVTTYEKVFQQVYVFPVSYPNKPELVQNVILVALKSKESPRWSTDDKELAAYLSNRFTKAIDRNGSILTDDYAPVENLTSSLYQR